MPAKSKFFRVAVEGATTDGRAITRNDIEQAAKNYDPQKYGARVWIEHIRGIGPDSTFKAFGDVLAVKSEQVDIAGETKLALFAQIDPTDPLVALVNTERQKVYTSIELNPNFADTGEAYLVGLGVTDSPASLGTEMLKFSTTATSNPLASRKQNPDNLFTAAEEATIEFEQEAQESLGTMFFNKIMGILGKKDASAADRFNAIESTVEMVATSQKELVDQNSTFSQQIESTLAQVQELSEANKKLTEDFNALTAKLESEEAPSGRPPASGGDTTVKKTDC